MPLKLSLTDREQTYVAESGIEFPKYIDGFVAERRA